MEFYCFCVLAGVPHNGELPYVIGYPFFQEDRTLRQDAQIVDVVRWDEEDQIWTLYMMEMWTNFAKFGYVAPWDMYFALGWD